MGDNWPGYVLCFVMIAYSLVLHEVAHGYAAKLFGDDFAEKQGRLTLNPVVHVDPVGTVIFPILQLLIMKTVFLGWVRPIPVVKVRLRPPVTGDIVVSLAGIIMNLSIALAMAILLGVERITPKGSQLAFAVLATMGTNVYLALLNLIPIPPWDGSHAFKYLLPEPLRTQYVNLGPYGVPILLILIVTGMHRPILDPPFEFIVELLFRFVVVPLRSAL